MRRILLLGALCIVPFSAQAAQPYRIISRDAWGADAALLFANGESKQTVSDAANDKTSESDTISTRQKECEENQKLYPAEFKAQRTVAKDERGRAYRWPLQYSKRVKIIVVHHTAIANAGDDRTSEEKMRALYEMHANGRGWGDIGYHYVIGHDGKIFEGKAGGDYVVGGHVYCGNVGTVGIALMGNFELELPTQSQMRALQWLIANLESKYGIDPDGTAFFHGKERPTVVGHRDLLSTDCPGYYVAETMDQIRAHVASGDLAASVDFPRPRKTESAGIFSKRQTMRTSGSSGTPIGVQALGATTIAGQPGGNAIFMVQHTSGERAVSRRSRIAKVTRSSQRIGLDQEIDGRSMSVREDLLLPEYLPPRSTQSIRLLLKFPMETGTYTLQIGDVRYTLIVKGRRARTEQHISNDQETSTDKVGSSIRIRLSTREGSASSCNETDLRKLKTQYRGTLECKEIAGAAAIINTLPLEDYLAGLAEEPDSEPYEKQRAFAIAARTYALYYLDPNHRKFPDMPYDGDDSPARFQSYKGTAFELKNPSWVKAVRATAHQALSYHDAIIKPPYFSSDDGKTRSPAEAGWKNFPNAEIFGSKPDPWCKGMPLNGHGVGMSGCGAKGQAKEGKTAEQILEYYYPKTRVMNMMSTQE
jgi:hypothetical protein